VSKKNRQNNPSKTPLPLEAPVDTVGEKQNAEGAKKKFWTGYQPMEKTTFVMTVFAVIYSITTLGLYWIATRQLDVMRKDQRAWLEFKAQSDTPVSDKVTVQIITGQPVTYPLRIINIGKTPARNIAIKVFLDIVDASQEPPLDRVESAEAGSPYPFGVIRAGIVFPNTDLKQRIVRIMKGGAPLVATDSEVSAVRDGKAYLAVYGIIRYDDIFKIHHWTRFCDWKALNGTFEALRCTQYNSVDDNE
jgi:hypothetical protein